MADDVIELSSDSDDDVIIIEPEKPLTETEKAERRLMEEFGFGSGEDPVIWNPNWPRPGVQNPVEDDDVEIQNPQNPNPEDVEIQNPMPEDVVEDDESSDGENHAITEEEMERIWRRTREVNESDSEASGDEKIEDEEEKEEEKEEDEEEDEKSSEDSEYGCEPDPDPVAEQFYSSRHWTFEQRAKALGIVEPGPEWTPKPLRDEPSMTRHEFKLLALQENKMYRYLNTEWEPPRDLHEDFIDQVVRPRMDFSGYEAYTPGDYRWRGKAERLAKKKQAAEEKKRQKANERAREIRQTKKNGTWVAKRPPAQKEAYGSPVRAKKAKMTPTEYKSREERARARGSAGAPGPSRSRQKDSESEEEDLSTSLERLRNPRSYRSRQSSPGPSRRRHDFPGASGAPGASRRRQQVPEFNEEGPSTSTERLKNARLSGRFHVPPEDSTAPGPSRRRQGSAGPSRRRPGSPGPSRRRHKDSESDEEGPLITLGRLRNPRSSRRRQDPPNDSATPGPSERRQPSPEDSGESRRRQSRHSYNPNAPGPSSRR